MNHQPFSLRLHIAITYAIFTPIIIRKPVDLLVPADPYEPVDLQNNRPSQEKVLRSHCALQCCQIWCISTNLVVLNFILWILKGHCGIHKNTKSGVFERKSRKLKFNGAFVEKKIANTRN